MRAEASISFDVGDTRISGQVVLLHILQEIHETVVVLRSVFLVDVVSDNGESAETIEPRTSLVAGTHPDPRARLIFTLMTRSWMDWGGKVNRLIGSPLSGEVVTMRSLYFSSCASSYVAPVALMPARIRGFSTGFSIFSPNM